MSKPYVESEALREWAVENLAFIYNDPDSPYLMKEDDYTCDAPLCETMDAVETMCAGCQNAYYCSKACQKAYA